MNQRETSSITAYFHIPPVWIEAKPDENTTCFNDTVFEKSLKCGIRVRVRRDGFFIFDFINWKPAPKLNVIEYPKSPGKIPRKVTESHKIMESYVRKRVMAMNVHLACLNTALTIIEKVAMPVKQYITADDYLALSNFEKGNIISSFSPFWSPLHTYLLKYANPLKTLKEKSRIRIIKRKTITESYEIFDRLLQYDSEESMVIAFLIYSAVKHYADHDFSTSLVMSWTSIEKFLYTLWKKLIETNRNTPDKINFINKNRKEKLLGRDFTASIIIEILSLTGKIDNSYYQELEAVRKVRNAWIHSLKQVSSKDAALSIRLAEKLLYKIHGSKLNLCISGGMHY